MFSLSAGGVMKKADSPKDPYADLRIERKSAWLSLNKDQQKETLQVAEKYKKFLNEGRTERLIVEHIESVAKKNGFAPLGKGKIKAGQKILFTFKNKVAALVHVGQEPLSKGIRVVASHIDTIKLDLKPVPLYEDSGLSLFNLHYYGGIKKYQWVNTPLALVGVVYDQKGKKQSISIGFNPNEPVFVIPDLLPHLGGKDFAEKKITDVITGEMLDAVAGNQCVPEEDVKEAFKAHLLSVLHQKYGVTERELLSAELTLVPAGMARDVGLDESLIGAASHDDRSCSFASLEAMLSVKKPMYTTISAFFDKEEIGSMGNTGAESFVFEHWIEQLIQASSESISVMDVLSISKVLSADVTAGVDPNFKCYYDLPNGQLIGHGVCVEKYGGSGGKSNSTDASSEFMHEIVQLMEKNRIPWQTGELGKVDQGGGGTIAMFFARYGSDVIDLGPCVLAMHSPFEILSKADLYAAVQTYRVFLEAK